MSWGSGTVTRQGNEGLEHMGRRARPEPDNTLNQVPFDLVDETGKVSDVDAFRARLRAIVADSANGLMVRMTRPPGGTVVNVFVPFRVLCPKNARGFILPDLQNEYLRWRKQQLKVHRQLVAGTHPGFTDVQDWLLRTYGISELPAGASPMDMFFAPEAFVRSAPPNSRGGVLIEALMGPSAHRTFVDELPSKRSLKMWSATDTRRVLRAAPENALSECAGAFATPANLRNQIDRALDDLGLGGDVALASEMAEFAEDYILDHIRRDKLAQWRKANPNPELDPPAGLIAEINAIDAIGPPNAIVTEDVIASIMGKKGLHPTELAHRMIEAQDLTKQWVTGITGDPAAYAQYRNLPGFTGLMDAVIRRDGYQKGHVFEIECIVELAEEAGGTGGMRLQVYFAGKKGPDIVMTTTNGKLAIKQAKSYAHYYRLVGPRRRFGGEFLRQFRSDLRRMLAEGPESWPKGSAPRIRTGPDEWTEVDSSYKFLIDDARLSTWLDSSDPAQLKRADDLRKRGIKRISDFETEINGFLSAAAGDSTARQAIRDKLWRVVKSENGVNKTEEMLLGEQIAAVTADLPAGVGSTLDDIHPRLLFAMRLAMDDDTGAVNVRMAQRIYQMNEPFQIGSRRIAPDSFVPWQGEFPDRIAAQAAEEDRMPDNALRVVSPDTLTGNEVDLP